MRTLTILLAALLAFLPDCLACSLCGLGGGPCAASADACKEECCGGADAGKACTCVSGCSERDEAPAPAALAPPALPPPAAADLILVVPGDAAPVALPAPSPRTAGPPARLPLRI